MRSIFKSRATAAGAACMLALAACQADSKTPGEPSDPCATAPAVITRAHMQIPGLAARRLALSREKCLPDAADTITQTQTASAVSTGIDQSTPVSPQPPPSPPPPAQPPPVQPPPIPDASVEPDARVVADVFVPPPPSVADAAIVISTDTALATSSDTRASPPPVADAAIVFSTDTTPAAPADARAVPDAARPADVANTPDVPVLPDRPPTPDTVVVLPPPPPPPPPPTPVDLNKLDWQWIVPSPTAPVNATAALYLASYPKQDNAHDMLFVGTYTTRTPNFFALGNLYQTAPTVVWSTATTGGLDSSAVTFDDTLTRVYALDTTGALYCFNRSDGTACANWPAKGKYSTSHGSLLASPWFDYDSKNVFFTDGAGVLHKIVGATGVQTWEVNLNNFLPSACPGGCATFQSRSSVIIYNGVAYVGNDGGAWYRVVDPGSTAPGSANITAQWLCGTPTSSAGCGVNYAILNGATLDVDTKTLYAAANGYLYEFAVAGGGCTHQVDLGVGHTAPMYSSPTIDLATAYVYVGYANKLFKVHYPFTGSDTVLSAPLSAAGPDNSYPHSSPMSFQNQIYIGDGAGYMERFGCVTTNYAPALVSKSPHYGTTVDSTAVIDYANGNVSFGYSDVPATTGGVVQISQKGAWGCGGGSVCTTAECGDICIDPGLCCTLADCGTAPPNGTYACNSSHACVLSCNSGYKICGTTCIPTSWCCTDADCAPKKCSTVDGSCQATETVTITFNFPANAGITSIQGQVYTPTRTLTTGTVTFTNGSTTVTGSGTTFTTDFKAGQRIGADGTNYYAITAVLSNTSLTLTAAYPQPTAAVSTYYQADCTSGQTCPSTLPFNLGVSCATPPCSAQTTATLMSGAYAITAKAYDSAGLTQAVNINANKLLLKGDANDQITPVVQLVRVYPIGGGFNATCPLNMAVDLGGNIWTVNGNGNSGSNCSGPTNNLSKLVKASNYAPTVINNSQITGSPEFIAPDASGNVWVTVPNLDDGIFKLDASGNTVGGFPMGSANCDTPRGVDVDPTQTPNGAFVACYGGVDTPPADGGRKVLRFNSSGTLLNSFAFTDRNDQPVSVSFARAFTTDSTVVYKTDYHCNYDVYVNRSSTNSVVVSRLPLDLASSGLSTYTQSAYDYNPYGMTYDGGGTIYTLARGNGNILNLEYDTSYAVPMHLDSDNGGRALPAPMGIAVDDLYSYNFGFCGSPPPGEPTVGAISPGNLYLAHTTTNRLTRTNNNPQTIMNDFIVGSTPNPVPRGAVFDRTTGYVWVANSAEGTLSRVYKHLFLLAPDSWNASPSGCPGTAAPGSTITLSGNGFNATAANNTVLVAGYLAAVQSASATSLTVRVPSAPSGVTGPITVSNADGHVVSVCSYTTL